MGRGSANRALRQIRTLYALGSVGGLTDGQLVERFLGRDGADREDAFAALVQRHGPMVLGVCRRMLRGSADAEDAFQEVFLILARKAGAVREAEGLKSWLYGVAVRTASEARRGASRRRAREGRRAMDGPRAVPAQDEWCGDLVALLDEEMGRLPGRYRDPLMLCELEGVSRRDAARRLGLAEGTLSSRLSRGRALLRDRLARRGVTLGTGMLAAMLPEPADAALPGPLANATVRLAVGYAAVGIAAGAIPWGKAISAAAVVLTSCALAVGLSGWLGIPGGANPMEFTPSISVAASATVPVANPVPDDPLPAGATIRFGSPRYRHSTTIESLAVSPDGLMALASSGSRIHGELRTYDLATGRAHLTLDCGGAPIEGVAFSPDGKTLAVKRNFSVHLLDADTGKETGRLGYPGANPSTLIDILAFSPDGSRVVIAAASRKALHLLDVAGGGVVRTFPHADTIFAAAFSPDGKHVAGGGYDGEDGVYFARLWETDTGKEARRFTVGRWGIRCLAFSADGSTLAIGGDYGKPPAVKLFEAASGKERLTIPFLGASSVRSVTFSPDGKTLAVSGGSSTRLFDTATGRERLEIDRKAIGLRFSPDGAVLIGAVAGTIYRWDTTTGRSLIPEGGEGPVAQIAVTADGKRLVTLGQDGDAHIWNARTGEHERRVSASWQRGFALSPDGRSLVWPAEDEAIQFKDPDDPRLTHTGSRLRMIDVATGSLIERFGGFEGDAQDLFFIAGGKTLVTADRYHRAAGVRLWDVATGRVERAFPAAWKPGARVWRSRLSPDEKVLAVMYQGEMRGLLIESEVKLWDIATGKERDDPRPYWSDVEVLGPGPAGKTVAVLAPDGRVIQFRDAATGQVRGEFRGPRDRVTALAFGPDGRLFTGSLDATVLAWDLPATSRPPTGRK